MAGSKTKEATTYKGDSPGKKIVRGRLWVATAEWMQRFEQPYYGSLVLAGHGGDVGVIKALNIDARKVTAVDLCTDAVSLVKEKHPGTIAMQMEAGQAALLNEVRYNTAHMDFCGGIGVDNLNTLLDVARGATCYPLMLNVTMLKGREYWPTDNESLVLPGSRRERRIARDHFREAGLEIAAAMCMHGEFDPRKALAMAEKRLWETWGVNNPINRNRDSISGFDKNRKLNGLGQALVRADIVRQVCDAALRDRGLCTQLLNVYSYNSMTDESKGTPFVSFMVLVFPYHMQEYVLRKLRQVPDRICFDSCKGQLSMRALKHYAISLTKHWPDKRVATFLDLPRGRVTAWKAHATMGTYEAETPEMKRAGIGISSTAPENANRKVGPWGDIYEAETTAAYEVHYVGR